MKKYIAGFALFVAGIICALILVRPAALGTPAQAQADAVAIPKLPLIAPATDGNGRFQLICVPNSNPLVIDTATGKVWRINGANNWEYQGSPK